MKIGKPALPNHQERTIDRANTAARAQIADDTKNRDLKTARLKAQRLAKEDDDRTREAASQPPAPKPKGRGRK
jgi:hypothetical protein